MVTLSSYVELCFLLAMYTFNIISLMSRIVLLRRVMKYNIVYYIKQN